MSALLLFVIVTYIAFFIATFIRMIIIETLTLNPSMLISIFLASSVWPILLALVIYEIFTKYKK